MADRRKSVPHRSSIGGTDANVMALIAYLITVIGGFIPGVRYVAWLVPLVLFFVEKESVFVKFHAMQAFVLQACGAVIGFILNILIGGVVTAASLVGAGAAAAAISGVLGVISLLVFLAVAVFAVIAMVKAYNYEEYSIPVIGPLSVKIADRLNNSRA